MRLTSPSVETLLDGHRISSDQGYIAFCSVTLTGVTAGQAGLELTDPGFQQTVMPGIEEQRLP